MRVLIIGSGAREHALLLGLARDPQVTEIHIANGNAGTEQPPRDSSVTVHRHSVNETSRSGCVALANEIKPDLVVIGPEAPLVKGVGDALRDAGFAVFGPNKGAALIEGSKAFAKDVMKAAGVRTAHAEIIPPSDEEGVSGPSDAVIEEVIDRFGPTWVVKDDGLAAGKGVVVTTDRKKALQHVNEVLAIGHPVLLESFLDGPEVSLFCLVDGETVVPLIPAQDHKRIFDNDEGPNTGGMGAYAPLPWLPEDGVDRIVNEVCKPVAKEMVKRGCPYSGLLYAGIAWGKEGPAVVEFNCRFGDPETQAILALLKTPLGQLLSATANGTLAEQPPLEWEDGAAIVVVLAAENYPAEPTKGDRIRGIDKVEKEVPGSVLHAGTARNEKGKYISAGGRVLGVVGKGKDLAEAREQAYTLLGKIEMRGGQSRSDIGLKAVRGEISIP
ncbi:MAG TPA: phosphoribosylamine--glycine ligase [Corynebacteriales bacterium]|nr:phosphoribosylamine--glycine ligase [Mycobacteriales bacterium]